jgi:hypothetical protein
VELDARSPGLAPVRVALVGCTGLLGDIISRAVLGEDGVEVVADLEAPPVGGLAELEALEVDLVLWNDADELRVSRWMDEVSARCLPRLLTTVGDGRDASLWQVVPHRSCLGQLSVDSLLATIRASSAAPAPS